MLILAGFRGSQEGTQVEIRTLEGDANSHTYKVVGVIQHGYVSEYSDGCEGAIGIGETKECTVTFKFGVIGAPLPPVSTAPPLTAIFDWSVPDRFGLDRDGEGMIDFDYSREYIHPVDYQVNFDACASLAGQGGTRIVSYTWNIENVGFSKTVTENSCKTSPQSLGQGNYRVTLTVTAQNGQTHSVTKEIEVKDILIVSIGDCVASGEGNPDIPQKFDRFGFVEKGVKWQNKVCHLSAKLGHAKAAIEIEQSDPHTSVTFIPFGC